MAFWVPGKDFTIGVTREDIEEYLGVARTPRPIEYVGKDGKKKSATPKSQEQHSFAYFIRHKLGVKEHQSVDIEVNYTDETTAKRFGQLGHERAQDRPDENNHVDLTGLSLAGANFSNIKFNRVNLAGVNLKGTNFLGATFEHMDLTHTNIEDALVGIDITGQDSTVTLTQAQKSKIDQKAKEFKKFADHSSDPQKLRDTIKRLNESTRTQAYTIIQAFVGSIGNPNNTLSVDEAFRITRLAKITRKDSSTKNLAEVKNASAQYIGLLFDKAFDKNTPSTQGWFGGIWASKDPEKEALKQRAREFVIKAFSEGPYLQQEFLPKTDTEELSRFFEKNIELLKDTSVPEETKTGIIKLWKDTQTSVNHRWATLSEAENPSKAVALHKAKNPGSSVSINLPKSISPYEKSSYPAIKPTDTEALARDIELKKRGAKFLATAAGGTAGAILATTLTNMFPDIPGVSTAGSGALTLVSTAIGGVAGNLGASNLITTENYKKFDSQLGDRLLEIGMIAEIIEPNIKALGANAPSLVASTLIPYFDVINTLGFLGNAFKSNATLSSIIALYGIHNDVLKSYAYIKAEKTKEPSKRNRPGSKTFYNGLKPKLFNSTKILIAATIAMIGMTALIATSVIAGPLAGPVLAVVGALPDLALFGLWIVGAVAVGATTYFGYGAVQRFAASMGSMFKMRKTETGVTTDLKQLHDKSGLVLTGAAKTMLKNKKKDKAILANLPEGSIDRLKEIRGNASIHATKKVDKAKLDAEFKQNVRTLNQTSMQEKERYQKTRSSLNEDLRVIFDGLPEKDQSWVLKIPKENREIVLSLSEDNLETLLQLPVKDRNKLLEDKTKDLEDELDRLTNQQFQDAPSEHEEEEVSHNPREDSHTERLRRERTQSTSRNHDQNHG